MRAAVGGMGGQQQKRKKWTEEEERALMDKYAEMQSDGSLRRLRTREKRFRPIAAHVNATHHARDPRAYPFAWSWKDACTKVQNMRHQFLLVKQKLLQSTIAASPDAIDWAEGLSLWPNFLCYKHVFGDAPLPAKPSESAAGIGGAEFPVQVAADDGDVGLGLGFDCCGGEEVGEEGFDYEEVAAPPLLPHLSPPQPWPAAPMVVRKKKKKKLDHRGWTILAGELARLREQQVQMEEREVERDRERRRRERAAAEAEEAREEEIESLKREAEERQQRTRQEEMAWEELMERRRAEWRKQTEDMLVRHRAEMEQIHARVLHEQQSVIGQLLSVFSQWPGPAPGLGAGLADGTGIGNHGQAYLSHMMQGLHHVNGMVPGENRVGGDTQEDQFIVDD